MLVGFGLCSATTLMGSGQTEICCPSDKHEVRKTSRLKQWESWREKKRESEMLIKNMSHKQIDEYANVVYCLNAADVLLQSV